MAKEKIHPSDSGHVKSGPDTKPADQAEGERDGEHALKVRRNPSQAEGEREEEPVGKSKQK